MKTYARLAFYIDVDDNIYIFLNSNVLHLLLKQYNNFPSLISISIHSKDNLTRILGYLFSMFTCTWMIKKYSNAVKNLLYLTFCVKINHKISGTLMQYVFYYTEQQMSLQNTSISNSFQLLESNNVVIVWFSLSHIFHQFKS